MLDTCELNEESHVQTTLIIRVAISNPMVTKSFVVQKLEETPHLPHNEETIEMWLRVMVRWQPSFLVFAAHHALQHTGLLPATYAFVSRSDSQTDACYCWSQHLCIANVADMWPGALESGVQ